jgi:hypothetical protein
MKALNQSNHWAARLSGLALLVLLLGCQLAIAAPKLPELPPLATVSNRDNSGETWQVEGSLGGSVPLAVSDFKLAFQRQGWQLDKVITLEPNKQVLLLWKRAGISMILMLREAHAGQTGFALGMDHQKKPEKESNQVKGVKPQSHQST